MSLLLSRRRFVGLTAGVSLIGLSGCLDESSYAATFTVYNELDREVVVEVEMFEEESNEYVFEEEWPLAAGETTSVPSPMDETGLYQIRVVVEDLYDESYEWSVSQTSPRSIHLTIDANGLELSDAPKA